MTNEMKYSSNLNGAPFMLYEFTQLVKLKDEGLSDGEIKRKVMDGHLLEHRSISGLKRALPTILKRVNVLDATLRRFVINESIDVSKVINFYTIVKTDRLFYEFMDEVIKENLRKTITSWKGGN